MNLINASKKMMPKKEFMNQDGEEKDIYIIILSIRK